MACFIERAILSESGEKYAKIKCHLQAKTILNKYVVGFDVSGQQGMDFYSLEEALLWIIDIKVKKHLNDGFVSYKHAAFHFTRC